jgi:hypothetical protein
LSWFSSYSVDGLEVRRAAGDLRRLSR